MVTVEYTLKNRAETAALKLFHSVVPDGKRCLRQHHHTAFEISAVVSGAGVYNVGGREYSFCAGDVFVFGSNEMHCITDVFAGEKFDLLNLHVEPRFLWSDSGLAESGLLQVFQGKNAAFENRLIRANEATETMRGLLFRMEREFLERGFAFETVIRTTLVEMLVLLTRDLDYIGNSGHTAPRADALAQMEKAMDYIDRNICRPFTLDDLARVAAMNPSYFSTVFKKCNGLSPWDYISIKRVEQAVFLLRTTDSTKMEIAEKCGFSSISNFYKTFRKITGKQPSDYTKEKA